MSVSDQTFEIGWGFILIIISLVANILMEAVVKPMAIKLRDKLRKQNVEISKIKKWLTKRL